MNIYLICGDAVSADGMAQWLRGHIGHVGVVIYYPQDEACAVAAKVFAKALGSHVADTALPWEWEEIARLAQQSTDIAVVVPDPVQAIRKWGGSLIAEFDPGAIAMIDGSWSLRWLVTPLIILPLQDIAEAARSLVHELAEAQGSYSYEEQEMKRWVADADSCEVCEDNADKGWVDMDDIFDGVEGDVDEPPAHPHCQCSVEQKTKRVRVYESGAREILDDGEKIAV